MLSYYNNDYTGCSFIIILGSFSIVSGHERRDEVGEWGYAFLFALKIIEFLLIFVTDFRSYQ